MKHIHMHIPSSLGVSTLILLAAAAVAFIYLSTSAFKDEMSIPGYTVRMVNNKYTQWFQKGKAPPYADIMFEYNQKQKEKMKVLNYEMSVVEAPGKITRREINALDKCYRDNICSGGTVSERVNNIMNTYKHSVVKDDFLIIYGLMPNFNGNKVDSVDTHMFIVGNNIFVDIMNPISSKLEKKYINKDVNFVDESDDMIIIEDKVWSEIFAEYSVEVTQDLRLLEKAAQSVNITPREK